MIRHVLVSLLLLAPSAPAVAGARVPATDVLAAARAALRTAATQAGVPAATLTPVGRVDDLTLVADAAFELRATPLPANWLRPRVAVPVEVHSGGRRVSTVNVWFAVSQPVTAPVYADAYARAVAATSVQVVDGTADLARTHGERPANPTDVAGLQLRRAVQAGQPLLASDFVATPAIRAQQAIRVESISGPIRLATIGRALADAGIGDVVLVLPSQAQRPVRARVISPEAVLIEN